MVQEFKPKAKSKRAKAVFKTKAGKRKLMGFGIFKLLFKAVNQKPLSKGER
jgi:hypothetical protein